MIAEQRLYTAEDLWALRRRNSSRRLELLQGTLVEEPLWSETQFAVIGAIARPIADHNMAREAGCVSYGNNTGFILARDPDTVLVPDVAFTLKERTHGLSTRAKDLIPHAPDLAVEVVSPTDLAGQLRAKIMAYMNTGTPLLWVAYPDAKIVDVYRSADPGQAGVVGLDGVLNGGDVLPDLTVPVCDLFTSIEKD